MTDAEQPWRDAGTLRRLYHGEGMSQGEIGEKLGCSETTIWKWMRKLDIPIRNPRSTHPRPRCGSEYGDDQGYELIRHYVDGVKHKVRHHRLIAACHYGIDAIKDKDIHHKNGIPWDNRPDNLEIINHSEHAAIHSNDTRKSGVKK